MFEITHNAAEFCIKNIKTAHFEAKRKLYKLPGQERVNIVIDECYLKIFFFLFKVYLFIIIILQDYTCRLEIIKHVLDSS